MGMSVVYRTEDGTAGAINMAMVVQPSAIHGFGVFSLQHFLAQALIYSTSSYEIRRSSMRGSIQRKPHEHLLDPVILRWVNHSCAANAALAFEGNEVRLASLRDIGPGEEITCDYLATEDVIPFPFRCNCGICDAIIIGGR